MSPDISKINFAHSKMMITRLDKCLLSREKERKIRLKACWHSSCAHIRTTTTTTMRREFVCVSVSKRMEARTHWLWRSRYNTFGVSLSVQKHFIDCLPCALAPTTTTTRRALTDSRGLWWGRRWRWVWLWWLLIIIEGKGGRHTRPVEIEREGERWMRRQCGWAI